MTPRWLPLVALVPGLMLAQQDSNPPDGDATPPPADAPIAPEPGAAPDGAPTQQDTVTPPPANAPMQRFQLDPTFDSMEANPPPGAAITPPPPQTPPSNAQTVTPPPPQGPPQ